MLDAGGNLVSFRREDGCGVMRYDIAFGKAWAALGMGMSTRQIRDRLASRPSFQSALAAVSDGRFIPTPGGVLILDADNRAIGAIGISGDASDKDEFCAVEAIKAASLKPEPPQPAPDWTARGCRHAPIPRDNRESFNFDLLQGARQSSDAHIESTQRGNPMRAPMILRWFQQVLLVSTAALLAGCASAPAPVTPMNLTTPAPPAQPAMPTYAAAEPLGASMEGWAYPYPVQMFQFELEGRLVRMAYMDVKPAQPNGRTVVLFHGKNFGGDYWAGTIRALSDKGYRVIAPDQIGFGRSSKPEIRYSFAMLSDNTLRLLDHLKVARVAVVADSMGGAGCARGAPQSRAHQCAGAREPAGPGRLWAEHSAAEDRRPAQARDGADACELPKLREGLLPGQLQAGVRTLRRAVCEGELAANTRALPMSRR